MNEESFKILDGYSDEQEFDRYVERHFLNYMTEFERKTYSLAILRQKARGTSPDSYLKRRLSESTPEVIEAARTGRAAVLRKFSERLKNMMAPGQLAINRCPNCNRIVRTSLAKQCLWCGHDWHRAEKAHES